MSYRGENSTIRNRLGARGGREGGLGGGHGSGHGGGRGGGLGAGPRVTQHTHDTFDDDETQGPDSQELVPDSQEYEESENTGVIWMAPGELWFDHSSISRDITNVIQQYFKSPWTCYTQVDKDTKEHWFTLFKRTYKWLPEFDHLAVHDYHANAFKRVRDMHYQVTKRMSGRKPVWMPDEVHAEMMKFVDVDGEFKKRSERAKKNRRGGSLTNKVEPSHFQGSISTTEAAKKMAKENGGKMPTAGELYLKTHTKEVPGKGKVLCSSKAKQIKEAYEKNVAECREKGINKDPNQIYFETVGGRKKGKVPGLGSGAALYYEPSTRRGGSSSSSYTPSMYSQLSARLEETQQQLSQKSIEFETTKAEMIKAMDDERLQRQREREEERKEREQERLERQRDVAELKRTMESYERMFSQCSGFPFSQSQDPRDPSGGGKPLC
ncbi:uncharacterized protein [Spinacia oleracea]|uniref:Transposase, Ptta/En/Spm, plant n=1 Tax=Spinacia oleracea TaxID=3562 RepID=A0ABM3R856_SPIOL|nr:uncharacterized protein LOC110784574 [Spinacia oleracea]XP_056691795.1 uncharacterized protein LOC110796089 [Spinacia oleracea]